MSKRFALAALLLSSFAAANIYQVPLGSSPFPTDYDFTTKWDDPACTVSRSTAFDVLDGPNNFSTSPWDPPQSVKISPMINKTNWEQWEFDGLSPTGNSFILMSFTRDYSLYFFGQGNLRIELYMTLPDGRSVRELDNVKESAVIDCPGYTAGLWNSSDRSYSFHVTKDLKHAQLGFDSWRAKGTYRLSATTPAVHADGSVWDPEGRGKTADAAAGGELEPTELSPGLYYSVPVAGGEVEVNLTTSSGRKLAFRGRGGSTRLWAKDGWLKVAQRWTAIRAWAGPYTFTYWEVVSRDAAHWGKTFVSGHLFHNDRLVVGTRLGNASATDDYVRLTANYGGEIHGRFADKNTGHTLEFGAPGRDRTWRFEMQHTMTQYEMGVGGGDGLSGFANRVFGGEVGDGLQYEGRGQTEQTSFPEYIPQWVAWLIFGVGFLGAGKDYALGAVSYFF
ncbi:f56bd267-6e38-41d4-bbd4-d4559c270c78 [Thermothielavioides terrestris]|uniref:F56bd267-6e38-41d4-bbd4-d4559c270c78 n=1 Tax=Thermothielavioides terrestris TaxID=2587410 RepID=A0A3S4D5Q5_9PEZI|nr:f56bd267-6e38-41d4-bbd4-d4559c270c78 [Thermothielavioides terrestris]